MTADMLFMPALTQKPPSSFQFDKPDTFLSDPSLKTEQPGLSQGDKHENFLATLKKLLRGRNPFEGSRQTASPAGTPSDKTELYPENEPEIDLELAGNDALLDIITLLGNDGVSRDDETQAAVGLKELVALLDKLGLNDSPGGRILLSGGELTAENRSNPAAMDQNRLTALKQLITEIQTNDFKPGNDSPKGSEFRLFVANILAADTTGESLGNSKDGLNLEQTGGSVDLANWAKGTNQGQENATNVNVDQAAEKAGTEKPAKIISSMTRSAKETENLFNSKASGSMKAVEPSSVSLHSESPEKTAPLKQNADMGAAVTKGTAREINISAKMPGQVSVNDNDIEMPAKAGISNRNTLHSQPPLSPDSGGHSGGEQRQESSLTGDYSPVSKLINDAQVEKENPIKIDIVPGDDANGKVIKLEAGTNDGGQLSSQTQPSEKAHETAFSPKATEAGQNEFRNQTMEQIVRRAVVQVRDGQHEARIDLKPDFMGHVRMQVITENQQVTVKILTEFGFVKDMIENNIQQLKADLQQQGLDVDKLDVSVSRDANGNKHQQENAEHARRLSHGHKSGDRGNTGEGQQEQKQRSNPRAQGFSTVDYFA